MAYLWALGVSRGVLSKRIGYSKQHNGAASGELMLRMGAGNRYYSSREGNKGARKTSVSFPLFSGAEILQWRCEFSIQQSFFKNIYILVKKHVSCEKVRLDPGIIVQSAFKAPNPCNYLTPFFFHLVLSRFCFGVTSKKRRWRPAEIFLLSSNGR